MDAEILESVNIFLVGILFCDKNSVYYCVCIFHKKWNRFRRSSSALFSVKRTARWRSLVHASLNIKSGRSMQLPKQFHPVVSVAQRNEAGREVTLVEYLSGVVHRF
ncbi:PREDICTED: uncharacterized protein LOC108366309 [Rhagoletis zephyria]|uniref:uncharacterized protein LOC108366309 n=1 Tax=Rhagoletis zephyria TaxID=28612 RepID=UPI0008118768|nr:PREDICTED: uncharacterized protein LOC108366309 [Rhagoletis zephyria]